MPAIPFTYVRQVGINSETCAALLIQCQLLFGFEGVERRELWVVPARDQARTLLVGCLVLRATFAAANLSAAQPLCGAQHVACRLSQCCGRCSSLVSQTTALRRLGELSLRGCSPPVLHTRARRGCAGCACTCSQRSWRLRLRLRRPRRPPAPIFMAGPRRTADTRCARASLTAAPQQPGGSCPAGAARAACSAKSCI